MFLAYGSLLFVTEAVCDIALPCLHLSETAGISGWVGGGGMKMSSKLRSAMAMPKKSRVDQLLE